MNALYIKKKIKSIPLVSNIKLFLELFNKENRFALWEHIINNLPSEGVYPEIRWRFYRRYLRECGRFYSSSGIVIREADLISIGEGSWFNVGCVIWASGDAEIKIGKNVMLGPYCVLRSQGHITADIDKPMIRQGLIGKGITIEDDCWLGSHVVVIEDVRIGKGSIIGAHSFVDTDIPPYSVAVGAPAKVIRSRT